jgi:hypothetical protein
VNPPGAQCRNNLKQIVMALHTYHHDFGCFPPACLRDKHGRPMHSWRVLVLPYLDCERLYKQYDFREPWDGPHNKDLLVYRPWEYGCPSDNETSVKDKSLTNYVAVVGPRAVWRAEKSEGLSDPGLAGKDADTIMLAEVANAGIRWTEPMDLSIEALRGTGSVPSAVMVSSKHKGEERFFYHNIPGAHVALVNGSVRFLAIGRIGADRLSNLFTIGGASAAALDAWDRKQLRINWPNCIALTVWLVSVGLLTHQAVRSRKRPPKPGIEKLEG